MARKCFYSFHYQPDAVRASQVRNIGVVEGNQPASDNAWEDVTRGGDQAIANWISAQMQGRTCAIVLVGQDTANRKWINHEIITAWNRGMGVVGIRIHGLKNFLSQTSRPGTNPFDFIKHGPSGQMLSSIVKCYNPAGAQSKDVYAWIRENIAAAAEEAITIRSGYDS